MIDAEQRDGSRKGIALLLLLLISLLALLRSSYTISTYYFSSSSTKKSSSLVLPLVANFSVSISSEATTASSSHQVISSETLPIYLIDTSNINHTNVAVSTWGEISTNWNRTTQYSNLLSLATAVPSLPNQYNNDINNEKRRQIILIHCGPKVGSTTLREACAKNLQRTCPQIDFKTYLNGRERRARTPAGYFGGDRLVSLMNECVDTHYFCTKEITVMDLLPSANTTTTTTTSEESDTVTITAAELSQNVEYIHLFPFRNYNDWVKSAIKQQHDRAGEKGCLAAKKLWDGGKCQHYRMEIDIRKYARVDLDRFQDGIVRRMNKLEGRGQEEHTFLLYLHRDLQQAMREISARYQMPMLPGTGAKLKGVRKEGTCNESLVEMYHECFSDSLMEFRWDLPENKVGGRG